MPMPPRPRPPTPDHAARPQRDDPEPRLSDLLDDPVLHILMARDGIDRDTLDAVIDDARRKLGYGGPSPFELTLLAECHAG